MRSVRRLKGALGRLGRDQAGMAATDFAIAAPIVITLLLGIIEFGHYHWIRNNLRYAIEEAGRYAMAHGTDSSAILKPIVLARAPKVADLAPTVDVVPSTVGGQRFVTISAQQQFRITLPFVDFETIPIATRTRVPLID